MPQKLSWWPKNKKSYKNCDETYDMKKFYVSCLPYFKLGIPLISVIIWTWLQIIGNVWFGFFLLVGEN